MMANFVEEAQAFTCFSYEWSNKEFLINSLKGAGATYLLPDVHFSLARDPFKDPRNQKSTAIAAFVRKHRHTALCDAMRTRAAADPSRRPQIETDDDIRGFDDSPAVNFNLNV